MDPARSWAERRRRPRRPDRRRRRATQAIRPLIGPRHAGHRAARPDRDARLRRRPRPPDARRARPAPLRAPRPARPRHVPGDDREPTPRATPTSPWILGGGWSMDDFPGGIPRRADLDRIVPDRPVFLSEPRRPQRLGQLEGARARRDHRRTRRTRRTAGSSATPTAGRSGRSRKAPRTSSSGWPRRPPRTSCWPRSGSRRPSSTRSGSRPGRTRS